MDNPGTSTDLLSRLLDAVDIQTSPCFSLEEFSNVEQDSPLLDLPAKVLDLIMSFIPLKERILMAGSVCRSFRVSMTRSISSIGFCSDQLDGLSDTHLKYFLSIYGHRIQQINFDLFKSSFIEECAQWSWRQSVISSVVLCPNLRYLTILVCNRHRLRDTDLATIFRESSHLESLSVDALFLNGYCFQFAPAKLKKLELEMCVRFKETSFKYITKLSKLKVLHFSQLLVLNDAMIHKIANEMRTLSRLSIVSHQESFYLHLTSSGLAQLGRLPRLRTLCLEGLAAVTDKFLLEFAQCGSAAYSIRRISLAFCFNVGSVGIEYLSRLRSLDSVNLDGMVKRDISLGLEKLSRHGRLSKLLLAENTNVSPRALVSVIANSPKLVLVDITNNRGILNEECARAIVSKSLFDVANRSRLTILTDELRIWNGVPRPPFSGKSLLQVVHVHRSFLSESEVSNTSIISDDGPSVLPHGLLSPILRVGNRYRVLWEHLGNGSALNDSDEKEPVLFPLSPQAFAAKQLNSEACLAVFNPSRPPPPLNVGTYESCERVPNGNNFADLTLMQQYVHNGGSPTPVPHQVPPVEESKENSTSNNENQAKTKLRCESLPLTPDFTFAPGSSFPNPPKRNPLSTSQPISAQPVPFFAPNQFENLDVLGRNRLRPAICTDNLVDFISAIQARDASGSGGAPRPPVPIPTQPVYHYTRGPRPKRRTNKIRPAPEPHFNPSDFPPLGPS